MLHVNLTTFRIIWVAHHADYKQPNIYEYKDCFMQQLMDHHPNSLSYPIVPCIPILNEKPIKSALLNGQLQPGKLHDPPENTQF